MALTYRHFTYPQYLPNFLHCQPITIPVPHKKPVLGRQHGDSFPKLLPFDVSDNLIQNEINALLALSDDGHIRVCFITIPVPPVFALLCVHPLFILYQKRRNLFCNEDILFVVNNRYYAFLPFPGMKKGRMPSAAVKGALTASLLRPVQAYIKVKSVRKGLRFPQYLFYHGVHKT